MLAEHRGALLRPALTQEPLAYAAHTLKDTGDVVLLAGPPLTSRLGYVEWRWITFVCVGDKPDRFTW